MRTVTVCLLAASLISMAAYNNISPADKGMKLFPIVLNKMEGYVDRAGKIAINPQFASAGFFDNGIARVRTSDHKYGFIDETGKYIINPQYRAANPFTEGFAAVVLPDSPINYIDTKGEVKIRVPFADEVGVFSEGHAIFYRNGWAGFINTAGDAVIPARFHQVQSFSEGLAVVGVYNDDGLLKFGFINTKGDAVVPCNYDDAASFSEGLAMVTVGDKCGYIDKTGKLVINPQFDNAGSFCNGYAKILQGDKFGFIDKTGKIVVNPQFRFAREFSENGLAAVNVGEGDTHRYGYIDTKGAWVINPQFSVASDFTGGIAFAGNDEEHAGIIDNKGAYKVNPQFYLTPLTYYGNTIPLFTRYANIASDRHTAYRSAMLWLTSIIHFDYAMAASLSTYETKNMVAQFAALNEGLSEEKKEERLSVSVRILDIDENPFSAEVTYALSSDPTHRQKIKLAFLNNEWLVNQQ